MVDAFGFDIGRLHGRSSRGGNETRLVRAVIWQLGWTTLPGLYGLSVSEFRAELTASPDNARGVAIEFSSEAECEAFLHAAEAEFAARRFTNGADAFDTVKAWVLERAGK